MNRSILLAACAALLVFSQAHAEVGGGTSGANIKPQVGVAKPANQAPRERAPPALPGARAEQDEVAPATRNSAEMPPTEALFDSVNRGDLAGAKEAVSRGADITGRNVLGLTPLELSVDLGRNQISFLLLSLRGGAGYSTSRAPATATATPKPPSRAERLAEQREERSSRVRRTAVEGPAPTPQTARLFAGNGGAPVPQAGFLGFDAGR